jgi:hypothetical protein
MGAIQANLDGRARVLAFTAFHVVLRLGLGVSAVVAGAFGAVLGDVGGLAPSRVVLLGAGIVVLLSAALVRVPDAS